MLVLRKVNVLCAYRHPPAVMEPLNYGALNHRYTCMYGNVCCFSNQCIFVCEGKCSGVYILE